MYPPIPTRTPMGNPKKIGPIYWVFFIPKNPIRRRPAKYLLDPGPRMKLSGSSRLGFVMSRAFWCHPSISESFSTHSVSAFRWFFGSKRSILGNFEEEMWLKIWEKFRLPPMKAWNPEGWPGWNLKDLGGALLLESPLEQFPKLTTSIVLPRRLVLAIHPLSGFSGFSATNDFYVWTHFWTFLLVPGSTPHRKRQDCGCVLVAARVIFGTRSWQFSKMGLGCWNVSNLEKDMSTCTNQGQLGRIFRLDNCTTQNSS